MASTSTIEAQSDLKAGKLFRIHFQLWKLMGYIPTKSCRFLYLIYSVFINGLITLGYPLHLMLGLFQSKTLFEVMKNLAINLTCWTCTIKTFFVVIKFRNLQRIFEIVDRQDKRIGRSKEELKFYKNKAFPSMLNILLLYKICYGMTALSSEAAVLTNGFMGNWLLMYPAYFPFDPFANNWLYIVAHVYQFMGVNFQITQNLVHDSFAGMQLALLSALIHNLNTRLSKIGYDKNKSPQENNRDLLECVQDHRDLLEYRNLLENVISEYLFFQIFISSFSMCLAIVFLLLFARDAFTVTYYVTYLLAMIIEILPSCYYGTVMEIEFQNLSYALFSTNWKDQDITFKKNLLIFAEQAKKSLYVTAWWVRINMGTFLLACRNAYSLFAVVKSMR